ncbi:MAG TPA: hypothetical protein VJ743_18490 [Albitalea sp.]|nr:hypothetical protein [Albitalea sp.]
MQNINLYDASLRIQRDWLAAGPSAAIVAAVLLAMLLAGGVARWRADRLAAPAREVDSALQQQQAAIQQLAHAVDALRPDPALLAQLGAARTTLEQRQAALQLLRSGALGEPQGHAAALEAIARQSITGLWLTGVVLDRHDMALRGRAMNPSLIPAYVGRLNREPALQGRSFRALDVLRPVADIAPTGSAAPNAAPVLAPFVEFSLSGAEGTSVKEPRP